MKTTKLLEIDISHLTFFSPYDEKFMFDWFASIKAITNIKGIGRTLILKVDTNVLNDNQMTELKALFRRYSLDAEKLIGLKIS